MYSAPVPLPFSLIDIELKLKKAVMRTHVLCKLFIRLISTPAFMLRVMSCEVLDKKFIFVVSKGSLLSWNHG